MSALIYAQMALQIVAVMLLFAGGYWSAAARHPWHFTLGAVMIFFTALSFGFNLAHVLKGGAL